MSGVWDHVCHLRCSMLTSGENIPVQIEIMSEYIFYTVPCQAASEINFKTELNSGVYINTQTRLVSFNYQRVSTG